MTLSRIPAGAPSARIASLVLALIAVATPDLALAQDAGDAGDRQEQELDLRATEFIFVEGSLPFVPNANTIATKLPTPLRLTPANVGIVTAPLFRQQYAQVLGDALVNVSNVNVQPGFGGVHDFFVVRGFDSVTSGLVLTDGAAEPEASFYQLYNVELIEVLKGPGGFLYGSNPLAGTVNLVRKQPFAGQDLRVGAALGAFTTVEGTLDYNYGDGGGDLAVRLNSMFRDVDGYRDGKESRVFAINPALTWDLSARDTLNVNLEYSQVDVTPEAGVPLLFNSFPGVRRENDYNSSVDFSDQDILRFQGDYEARFHDGFTVRNKLYYRSLDWRSNGTLINGAFPDIVDGLPTGTFSVSRSLVQLADDQKLYGNQLEAIFELQTGGLRHDLLTGIEVTFLSDDFTIDAEFLPPVDLFAPVDILPDGFAPIPGQFQEGDSSSLTVAPYAIDQITVNEYVQVLAGARLDFIDFDESVSGTGRSDAELSPMLGIVGTPRDDLSIYANYTRSFAPPSPRAVGDDLQPESSEQLEAGVKVRLPEQRAQATVALYRIERDNIPIPDENGFTQQIGNQRSTGFEVELAAEPDDTTRAILSYAYNDSELTEFAEQVFIFTGMGVLPVIIDRSGNRPAFAPEHMLTFWGSKTLSNGLGVAVGARYLGNQFIAEDNAFAIDDAIVLSGAVSYAWDRIRLNVNVKNLTDTDHLVRAFGSQAVTPAAPIAFFGRIEVGL